MKNKKIILWSLSIVLFLISALFFTIINFFPGEKIKSVIETETSKIIGLPVKVDKVGISLLGRPSVKVSGIVIGEENNDKTPLAKVSSVYLDLKLLPLLRFNINVGNIRINEPLISVITYPDSTNNLPPKKEKTNSDGKSGKIMLPIPISVNSFKITNGRILFEKRTDGKSILVNDIDSDISLDIDRKTMNVNSEGVIKFSDISFSLKRSTKPINGINSVFSYKLEGNENTGDFRLTEGVFELNGIPAEINASLKNWKLNQFNFWTKEINLVDILKNLPAQIIPSKEKILAQGFFSTSVSAVMDSTNNKLSFNGKIEVDGENISYVDMPTRVNKIESRIEFNENTIDIKTIVMKAGKSDLHINGVIIDYSKKPYVKLITKGEIDLTDVFSIIPSENGLKGKGLVGINVTMDGNTDSPEEFKASGEIKINGCVINIPKSFKNPLNIDGNIGFNQSVMDIKNINVVSGKSDFSVSGNMSGYSSLMKIGKNPPYIKGVLRSKCIDIENLMIIPKNSPVIKPWDVEGIVKTAPVPPGISGELKLDMGKIVFGKLKCDNLTGTLILKKDSFLLENLKISAYKGNLGGKTFVDFRKPENVKYSGEFVIENLDASSFVSDFFNTGDIVSGKFSSELSFAGSGTDSLSFLKNLTGGGYMVFDQGQIKNIEPVKQLGDVIKFLEFDQLDFEKITNTFTIKDQYFYTPDMMVKSKTISLGLDGKTGFDTSINYKISALLDKDSSKKAVKTLNTLSGLNLGSEEQVELKLSADGTIKSPKVKLVSSSVSKQLKEAIKEKTDKFLEKQDETIKKKGKKLLDNLFKK